jgi:predicted NBD/HSP70 family sugar kinase
MASPDKAPLQPAAAVAPSLLREMNQRLLLDRLFRDGPATRPQLARDAGLSLPTVSAALADLEQAGLVRRCGGPEATHGRPAAFYEANPTAGTVVGVDIGHEWLRLLVTDLAGEPLSRLEVRNTARSARTLVDLVSRTVTEAVDEAGIQPAAVTHTVIGAPGVFDAHRGRVAYAANIPGWQRPGLADALAERLGSSLTIDNDANLAALGEYTYGAAREARHLAYVMIGTGVGLGLLLDGQVYRGATGAAGEIGYLPLAAAQPPLAGSTRPQRGAPRRGLLEEALAADAVVGYAKDCGMPGSPTAEEIFAAARTGDVAARRAISTEAAWLAHLLAGICAFLDPEVIIMGGGIGQNLDLLEPDIATALTQLTPLRPTVVVGELGPEAIIRGAIAAGIRQARQNVFLAHARRTDRVR